MDLTLAKRVGEQLLAHKATLVTAESCTGGGLAYAITSIPGSSQWFNRAYVTYTNQAKMTMLGIASELLDQYGAVSKEVALQMAERALRLSSATWSIAVTGIAGPDGGTPDTPVGTVWIAWASQGGFKQATVYHFTKDRLAVREQAIDEALRRLESIL
jgi:nicotinamide-nucleotide amidase